MKSVWKVGRWSVAGTSSSKRGLVASPNRFGHVRRQLTGDTAATPISPPTEMSSTVSIQQILGEARRLVGRLREQDGNADRLLTQAQAMSQGVEAMRQYHEELAQLSCVAATPRPRAALVLSIQQENRHMRELQQENRELVAALKEHQSALELIMAKYREQASMCAPPLGAHSHW
ncbi:hypothetical protein MRX96_054763 [Rhipicephalus microplus]